MMLTDEHGYMSDRDAATAVSRTDVHAEAVQAFIERARSRFGEQIEELYVFGSTVRDEARGLASDVDVLVVPDDADREATADGLRDIAYDVMLEYGPVVELHILSTSTFERYQREGNPFIRNVVTTGRSMAEDDGSANTDPSVKRELEQARQALTDAGTGRANQPCS